MHHVWLQVPANSAIHTAITKQLSEVVAHVDESIGQQHNVAEATAYFRVHPDGRLYLLFVPALLVTHALTGTPIHPDFVRARPRTWRTPAPCTFHAVHR